MSYLADVVLFPLLLWLLSWGCGLLVERICAGRLPALLVLPVGFGLLLVVSQFTTWLGWLAPLTPLVLVALALAGLALGRGAARERWVARKRGWWLGAGSMVAAYLILAAPEIVAGRPTFTGYLLDTTGAIQVAGGERLLHYGHSFNGPPAYGTTLHAYFGSGYPSGGQGLMAAIGWLTGQNLIWLYSLFQALALSVLALVATFIARRAGLRRAAASVAGTIAAVPALVYAYALMGSIKELTALPVLMLMGALMLVARELRERMGIRAVIPYAIAGGASLGAIGIAASPWVGLFGVGALLCAVPLRRPNWRPLAIGAVSLAVATALAGLPTVGPLGKTLTVAEGISNSDSTAVADPGNLLRPLKFIQTLGVWLGESHRVEPRLLNQTYLLMGVVIACLGLGLLYLVRRRAWGVLAFMAISLATWAFLHQHGTTWTDAKLLVILSPEIVLLAMVGALGLLSVRRLEGILLAGAVVFGVLASDGLLYHATNLAPTVRYEQLAAIGERYAGQGPTLATDFDEYAVYLLRDDEVDMPGVAYSGDYDFVPGVGKRYGFSYDLDTIALPTVEQYRTIVMRRSPAWSRPPSNFHLVQAGRYYTVWQRRGPAPAEHVPLGSGGWEPASVPSCSAVHALAQRASKLGADILYSPRRPNVILDLAAAARSPNVLAVTDLEGRPDLAFGGPGRADMSFRVARGGRYRLWLGGDVDRPMHVILDGRQVGAPSRQSGDDGTTIFVTDLELTAGRHELDLVRGGADLAPDDSGSSNIDGVVFEPEAPYEQPVLRLPAAGWRSVCGTSLDWMEIS